MVQGSILRTGLRRRFPAPAGTLHRKGRSRTPYLMPVQEVLQKYDLHDRTSVIVDNKMLIRVEDVVTVGDSGGVPLRNYSKDIIVI